MARLLGIVILLLATLSRVLTPRPLRHPCGSCRLGIPSLTGVASAFRRI